MIHHNSVEKLIELINLILCFNNIIVSKSLPFLHTFTPRVIQFISNHLTTHYYLLHFKKIVVLKLDIFSRTGRFYHLIPGERIEIPCSDFADL